MCEHLAVSAAAGGRQGTPAFGLAASTHATFVWDGIDTFGLPLMALEFFIDEEDANYGDKCDVLENEAGLSVAQPWVLLAAQRAPPLAQPVVLLVAQRLVQPAPPLVQEAPPLPPL